MKHRKGKTAGKEGHLKIVGRRETQALQAYFADQGQLLLPLLELVQDARTSIDELMSEAARSFVEQLLVLSAQEVAGGKQQGKARGEIGWHGTQTGRIVLSERKLSIQRPRLRSKGPGSKEVAVPVYARIAGRWATGRSDARHSGDRGVHTQVRPGATKDGWHGRHCQEQCVARVYQGERRVIASADEPAL